MPPYEGERPWRSDSSPHPNPLVGDDVEREVSGLGDCDWGAFFAALTDVGYRGPIVIEVEDRAYEYGLEGRQRALRQSLRYIEPFIR